MLRRVLGIVLGLACALAPAWSLTSETVAANEADCCGSVSNNDCCCPPTDCPAPVTSPCRTAPATTSGATTTLVRGEAGSARAVRSATHVISLRPTAQNTRATKLAVGGVAGAIDGATQVPRFTEHCAWLI